MTNFVKSGERDDSIEATQLIDDIISEVLKQGEFEVPMRRLTVPAQLVQAYDIEEVTMSDGIMRIARPDTEEHTLRTRYLIRRKSDRLMSLVDIEVPRDHEIEVSDEELHRVMDRYQELIAEGDALGIIDKFEMFEKSEKGSEDMRQLLDSHAFAIELGDMEAAERIRAELMTRVKTNSIPERGNTGDPEIDEWVKNIHASQAERIALGERAIDVDDAYTRMGMAALASAHPSPVTLAQAWEVQRDVDRALHPES